MIGESGARPVVNERAAYSRAWRPTAVDSLT